MRACNMDYLSFYKLLFFIYLFKSWRDCRNPFDSIALDFFQRRERAGCRSGQRRLILVAIAIFPTFLPPFRISSAMWESLLWFT